MLEDINEKKSLNLGTFLNFLLDCEAICSYIPLLLGKQHLMCKSS